MLDAENAPENPESTPTPAPGEEAPQPDPAPAHESAQKSAQKPAKKAAAKKTTAKKTAAKKTAAKRTTKKVAATPGTDTPPPDTPTAEEAPAPAAPAGEAAATDSVEEAPAPAKKAAAKKTTAKKAAAKKTTAKRTTKKAAAAEAAGTGPGADAEATAAEETVAADVAAADQAGEDAGAPQIMPLFKAPEPTGKPATRRRKTAAERAAEKAAVEEAAAEETAEEAAAGDTVAKVAGDAPEPEGTDEGEDSDEDEGNGSSRRRRRRGGRRRRKSGADTDATDNTAGGNQQAESKQDNDDDSAGEGSSSRRRRRRRRSGDDADSSADEPNTVTRVRKPRTAEDEITSLTGSTRLEAKKQRRREGREAGRRRAPIVSEAEFLARREAVDRVMVIRQKKDLTQIAVLEDKVLVEHYVARESQTSLIGNVYLGRVQNVLPSMEAAFIDIGKGRNAVLYAGEVNWDSLGAKDGQPRKIESVLKSGQTVLVQVTKDPIGHKGARLTSQISLPGRFLVYVPDGTTSGISRKLPDTERSRLKSLLKEIVPDTAGVIVRTAAEGASEEELTRDVERLTARWDDIQAKAKGGNAPQLLYGEPDLTLKVVRDLFTEDFGKLVVAGDDAWDMVEGYVQHVAPDLAERLERYDGSDGVDVFAAFRIDEQIAKGLDRKVWLPSGGSLIIDRTEAMTVVDVNTGKFTGSGGNLEETVTKNNLEAAEEIVRQLRLRDIGGIIVVDFIDMVLESNRDLVLRRMVECLGRDRTRHQVAEVTSLGLVQMTRKRIGTGLLEAFSETCEQCQGRGVLVHHEPVENRKKVEDEPRRGRRSGRGRGRDDAPDSAAPSPKDVAAMAKPDTRSDGDQPDAGRAEAGTSDLGRSAAAAPEAPASAGDGGGRAETKRTRTAKASTQRSTKVAELSDEPPTEQGATEARKASATPQTPETPGTGVTDTAPRSTRTRRRAAQRPQGPAADGPDTASAAVVTPAPVNPPEQPVQQSATADESVQADGRPAATPTVVTSVRKRGAARRPAGPPAGSADATERSGEPAAAGAPTKDANPASTGADVPVDGLAAQVAVEAPEPAPTAHVPVKKKGRKR